MKNEVDEDREPVSGGQEAEGQDAAGQVTGPGPQAGQSPNEARLRMIGKSIDAIGAMTEKSLLYWVGDESGRVCNFVPHVDREAEPGVQVVQVLNEFSTAVVDVLASWLDVLQKAGISDVMRDERLRLVCSKAKEVLGNRQ